MNYRTVVGALILVVTTTISAPVDAKPKDDPCIPDEETGEVAPGCLEGTTH
jgi:hypothetical protein